MGSNRVVVLTALPLEAAAVRALLPGLVRHDLPAGTIVEEAVLPGTGYSVCLVCTGPGIGQAAVVAERVISWTGPAAVLFVGVAGAVWRGVALGDVVAATRALGYQGGKDTTAGFRARPEAWAGAHRLLQVAQYVDASASWLRFLPEDVQSAPEVHFKPVASGDVVKDARDSPLAELLETAYNDAAAIEMEAAGVARAAHHARVDLLVVRGISDYADGTKSETDGGGWQLRAASHAAAFACGVIAALPAPTEAGSSWSRPAPAGDGHGADGDDRRLSARQDVAGDQLMVGEIPREPPAFVKRQTLARLAEAATSGKAAVVCAVTGLRGVGKTQLAAAYARDLIAQGCGLVGWVNAESRGSLLGDLARVADAVGVADPEGDSAESARRLREHLTVRTTGSLLVFDNAADPDLIRAFLPAAGSAQVVITSTSRAFILFGTPVDVAEFSRDESLGYLATRTGLDDQGGAAAVAEELGDLPLGIAQASAVIAGQRLSYRDYLQRLGEVPVDRLLGRPPGDDYPRATVGVKASRQLTATRQMAMDLLEPQLHGEDEAWARREDGAELTAHIEAIWQTVAGDPLHPEGPQDGRIGETG